MLSFPVLEVEFIVDTDASNSGIGAVLSQPIEGKEKVVAFFSPTLSKPEQNYCVYTPGIVGCS
ncbi:ribonuclease H family protein [Staphylococcus aureus]